jgi:hypothetical protein
MFLKLRYHVHLFFHRHNEALVKDALCTKLKARLMAKANHHLMKANSVLAELEAQEGKIV